ncbi:multicopper oxidase domain-containing protein [Gemmatimonas phototrophica]|uniref:multicopper oxidase domain-containing protein n=1 Tax=Gemmatimonas phototrophica TaxID=1379270 RepID=UPI000A53B6C3|nr:multicopper oxidase domain-containing protein [Gemmatimonas phototrophica]
MPTPPRAAPVAAPNDNRTTVVGTVPAVALTLVEALWKPEGGQGPALNVWAMTSSDSLPVVPSPLIRMARGRTLQLRLTNTLRDTIDVHGLRATREANDVVVLLPGESRTISVTYGRSGQFLYWGGRHGQSFDDRGWEEGQLTGAIVVDDPQQPRGGDRVFVVTESFKFEEVAGRREVVSQLAVNGLSWPHTEPLRYAMGDSVHWRWLNGATIPHPMHLHGFYYRVSAMTTLAAETRTPPARQPLVVTQYLPPGNTMQMAFLPTEPGNWVFHCHFAQHVNGVSTADTVYRDAERRMAYTLEGRHMSGLVMGLTVTSPEPTPERAATRHLRLFMDKKSTPFTHGGEGVAFALADSTGAVAQNGFRVPAPVLLLKRGERVAITLVNRLPQATSVHWHGLEIESYPDGVPHVSGRDGKLLHPIPAGDSLTVNFAPPRSGTFMYHSHFSEASQMNGGMYGAILVLDDPARYSPATDHLFVIGGGGIPAVPLGTASPWGLVNGRTSPPPVSMKVGERHRFRFASIHPDWEVRVTLGTLTQAMAWTPVAKDGAELPAVLRTPVPATWMGGPGETADFEVTPSRPGDYLLQVRTESSGWSIVIPVTVKAVGPR